MASPCSLLNISLNSIVHNHVQLLSDVRLLPGNLQCDIYRQVKTAHSCLPVSGMVCDVCFK